MGHQAGQVTIDFSDAEQPPFPYVNWFACFVDLNGTSNANAVASIYSCWVPRS